MKKQVIKTRTGESEIYRRLTGKKKRVGERNKRGREEYRERVGYINRIILIQKAEI